MMSVEVNTTDASAERETQLNTSDTFKAVITV